MDTAIPQYIQTITNAENENFRDTYIREWIKSLPTGLRVLDVGAGEMPFKSLLINQGLRYSSHDFEQYDGSDKAAGLQNAGWPISGHDIVCDIEELPSGDFDIALCTEVLEHVPNPVSALRAISGSVKSGGVIMITVPFSSRMHQAPYWYSSGLSPFWFEKHSANLGLRCEKVVIAGDYVDQILSELPQFLSAYKIFGFNLGYRISIVIKRQARWLRTKLPKDLVESGGLGVYVELRKI
jgi:SAM-dependent methyltransferase